MLKNIFLVFGCFAVVTVAFDSTRLRRDTGTCGEPKVSSGLIVRGQSFSRGNFPWIVALMYTKVHPPAFFCGGTIISSNFVISAAHCINEKHSMETLLPRDVLASFGAHVLSDLYESGRYSLSPKKIILHDEWNPRTTQFDGDLSLLEFEKGSIHFNDFVQPICLWNSETKPSVTEGTVAGWGKSEDPTRAHENVPKLVKVSILNNAQCLPGEDTLASISSHQTFCAGLKNGSGVCSGDSGGGLFIKVNDVYFLKGIVSSSLVKDDTCVVTKSAVYTNVFELMDWISKKIGITLVLSALAPNEASCSTFDKVFTWSERDHSYKTCNADINKAYSEDFAISSVTDRTILGFNIQDKKEVKFLPTNLLRSFPNLKVIRVWSCAVTSIKSHFKGLSKLESLILALNEIEFVANDAFVDLTSLEHLDLGFNKIQFLGENTFDSLTVLKNLYLHENRIQLLSPKIFSKLSKVEHIALYMNNIEHIATEAFNGHVNLEFLDFGFNKVQFLGEGVFDSLVKVKKLLFHVNEIQFIHPKAFGKLANAEYIALFQNKISNLDENVFENATNVKIINLNDNKLGKIPRNLFKNNLNLEEIWFNGNSVNNIDAHMFDHLQLLKFVELKNNLCIDKVYSKRQFNEMRNDLEKVCGSV